MFCSENQNQTNSQIGTVKKIGNYLFRYEDLIGSGNFSKVYSGVDQNTGRMIAVKVVKMSSLKSKISLKLLQNQISILKNLDHPNLIKCFDELTSINNFYIITQLCAGNLQGQLRKRGKFQEKQISKWIWQILKGLQYLQNQSIIHRDIKAANVFISSTGTLKIADFGFALKSKVKFKDLNIGSPIYMSPQGLIYHQYGPKTDVWSLGVLIYQLLHGNTPLQYCNTEIELKNKVVQPPILKAKISFQLKHFLQNCFKVNEQQRFSIKQLINAPYAKRIKIQAQGNKIYKSFSSGNNSTFNSMNQLSNGSCNLNKFQILDEISYDSAVAILHYCRFIHKTCQQIKSQILSHWLLNISLELSKTRISKNHTDQDQYERLRQVIIQYHKKYNIEHKNITKQIMISEILKEINSVQKFLYNKQWIQHLLKETKLVYQCMKQRKWTKFAKESESKHFLFNQSNKQNSKK